jgi:hypothetical protein
LHPEIAALARLKSAPQLGEDGQEHSQIQFLMQTLKMHDNPNKKFRKLNEVGDVWSVPVNEARDVAIPDRQRLLRWGLSTEGEGRAAYLRTAYASLPQERYFCPKTSAQEIGFYTSTQHVYDSDKHVHVVKPMNVDEPPPKPLLPAPPRVAKIFFKHSPLEGAAGFAALHGNFHRGGAL